MRSNCELCAACGGPVGDCRKVVLASPASGFFAGMLAIACRICQACAERAAASNQGREVVFAAVGRGLDEGASA